MMNKFNKRQKVITTKTPTQVGVVNYVITIELPAWKGGGTNYKYNVNFPSIKSDYDFDEENLKAYE